jgi:hypothetical protein
MVADSSRVLDDREDVDNSARWSLADSRCECAAYQWDYVFDWTVLKYQQTQASRRPPREPAAIGPGKDDHEALLQSGNGAGV